MNDKQIPAVRTEEVWKVFEHDGIAVEAVRGISLKIQRGEFVVLAGPSGSGKTTLLNMLGGLTHATRGRVWIDGQDLSDMSERERARLRLERVGFVFQAYNLLPVLTAAENAEFTLLLRGMPDEERQRRVTELFERIGIGGLEDRRPTKLSGGQQQRVAVARALAGTPAILLADEPTGNLDSKNGEAVMRLLDDLHGDGATICMVTHDPRYAEHADRTLHLFDGQIVKDGNGEWGSELQEGTS